MANTAVKNDTTAVTRSIMVASENKEKKKATNAVAKNPTKAPAKKPTTKDDSKKEPKTNQATETCYYINEHLNLITLLEGFPIPIGVKIYKKAEKKAALAEIEKLRNAKKEDTAVAMSTDAFSKEILSEFQKRTKAIKKAIGNIDTSFESIAFNIHWINTKQAYKAEGFPTIIEYAAEAFGYQKTTCYSLIAVVDRFAKRNEKGEMLEAFEDRVKGFSVSKLSLMVNLTDSEIESLKPTMSVRDIKKYVKGLEGKALPALSEGDGEPEEDESTEENEENIVDSTAKVISNTLIRCTGKEDYDKKTTTMLKNIANVFKQHPDAVIEVSYTLPAKQEEKA